MSRKDREVLQAWLDADPAMRAAWDGFHAQLTRVAAQLAEDAEPDLTELQKAAAKVRAEAGEDQPVH